MIRQMLNPDFYFSQGSKSTWIIGFDALFQFTEFPDMDAIKINCIPPLLIAKIQSLQFAVLKSVFWQRLL
jgi:hypothetical protein